jgi:hypothetical protein
LWSVSKIIPTGKVERKEKEEETEMYPIPLAAPVIRTTLS